MELGKVKEILGAFFSDKSAQMRSYAIGTFFSLFISYLTASTLAVSMIGLMGASTLKPSVGRNTSSKTVKGVKKSINYRNLRKSVKGRNIFNSSGEFPDETEVLTSKVAEEASFNPSAPCSKSTMNLELLGTIFMRRFSSSFSVTSIVPFQSTLPHLQGRLGLEDTSPED